MGKLFTGTALLFILAIDIFLFMGQYAVADINPGNNLTLIKYNDTIIKDYDSGGFNLVNKNTSVLPSQGKLVSETTQETIFTDPVTVIINWIGDKTGFNYFINILGGPTSYLKTWGLPSVFVFLMGAFWYGITLYMLIAFILGRE